MTFTGSRDDAKAQWCAKARALLAEFKAPTGARDPDDDLPIVKLLDLLEEFEAAQPLSPKERETVAAVRARLEPARIRTLGVLRRERALVQRRLRTTPTVRACHARVVRRPRELRARRLRRTSARSSPGRLDDDPDLADRSTPVPAGTISLLRRHFSCRADQSNQRSAR